MSYDPQSFFEYTRPVISDEEQEEGKKDSQGDSEVDQITMTRKLFYPHADLTREVLYGIRWDEYEQEKHSEFKRLRNRHIDLTLMPSVPAKYTGEGGEASTIQRVVLNANDLECNQKEG